jgi:hypothetical protein
MCCERTGRNGRSLAQPLKAPQHRLMAHRNRSSPENIRSSSGTAAVSFGRTAGRFKVSALLAIFRVQEQSEEATYADHHG